MTPVETEISRLETAAAEAIELTKTIENQEEARIRIEEINTKLEVAIRSVKIKYYRYRILMENPSATFNLPGNMN